MAVTKRSRTIEGRKKTVYEAEAYVRGVRIAIKTFDTQAAAYAWIEKEKQKVNSGNEDTGYQDMTFLEVVERYSAEALPLLRKSTQQAVGTRIKYLTGAPVAHVPMRTFSDRHIDQWIAWMHKHPTAKSPHRKSFGHELRLMKIVLNWYRSELNYRFQVPVTKRHGKKVSIPGKEPVRMDRFLRKEDLPAWLNALAEHSMPVYWDLAKFMLLTGVRLGEACGLCWDVVDFERRCIKIVRTVAWDLNSKEPYLVENTKTAESVRVIGLPEDLVLLLKKRKLQSGITALVFANRDGGYLRQTKIYDVFKTAFKRSGLQRSGTKVTRHTWATLGLVANDGNIAAIQANMGHTSRTTTERYAKPVRYLYGSAVEKTAEYMALPQNPGENPGC